MPRAAPGARRPAPGVRRQLDWTELEARAEAIRGAKLKNGAGRPPHLRALLGAMVLPETRYMPYRVLEDQIRHYAPARYLCALTETEWSLTTTPCTTSSS